MKKYISTFRVNDDKGRIAGFKKEIAQVYMKWNFSISCKENSLIVELYNENHVKEFLRE